MKKHMILLVTIFSILLSFDVNVYAEEASKDCEILDSVVGIDLQAQQEESERLVEIGKVVSKRRSTAILSNFKNLQQGDARWKNEVMLSKGVSIGSKGCCLTSFTMIQQYYGGTDTPAQVNAKLGNNACLFRYAAAASTYQYTCNLVTTVPSTTYAKNYIKGAINSGQPVLIGMESSNGSHFVAAYGYNGDDIIISDPAARKYQTLAQYLNTGYTIYRLCTYYN